MAIKYMSNIFNIILSLDKKTNDNFGFVINRKADKLKNESL